MGSRRDGARRDHGDLLVVDELLAAGGAFLLVRLDEALDERDRMATDAAELVVHVLDGQLRAGGREPADHHLATLLVHPADVHLRQLGIRLPALPVDVREVVRDRRPGRRGCGAIGRGVRRRGSEREYERGECCAYERRATGKAIHGSPST